MKFEKQCKDLLSERDKMKQRFIKLKNRKGKVDLGIKTCMKCNNEFREKENFNWSCKQHIYPYSDDVGMWWCCGNRNKNHGGCIFSKHESKEDDDDDDGTNDAGQQKQSKYLKCNCCKEMGHQIDDCPRDPNIKTKGDPGADMERV